MTKHASSSVDLQKRSIDEWLHDLENRSIQEIHLGLSRIMEVAKMLDLQLPACPVITVGGTNGKGSTVTALEAIYHGAGYKVGTYTSPHLIEFNERIRINLTPISDEDLCQAFSVIEEARGEIFLTYFEMTTLAALWYFKKNYLDILILEVGLGGRLDATNIVDAQLSIITTVDFDHQDYLGTTLDAIGYEKAGILRPGKPFIYADINPPTAVIDAAMQLVAPSFFYNEEFSIHEQDASWDLVYNEKLKLPSILGLPKPSIQLKSAAAAITACLLLSHDLPVAHAHFQMAMKTIFIPGRLQLQKGSVSTLFDVSHNAQSVKLLADTLFKFKKSKIHAVFSALKDKDIFNLIMPLKDCVDRWYLAQLDNKRAASADMLLAIFSDAEIPVEICYTNPLIAFETALKQAKPGDLIVVYGSFFTVSHVMANRRFNEISN
ncbi:bifunctional tetrahydrofolate synthase/dihydrofolate synthase [Fluoribacter dumoffii]|uniref:bifunctional tetrahydrofolate synthase/dihydrofolate synthase n=1 Tax=Fluoribacter dumoffii TaxID=463 RepID=UPI002243B8D9|nr:bifunctional tetrahydrofolate synthase/dihydrofolate synthase [Fluoribacter dumoffii]MCW8418401.1 bifunctional tetrahydrofolate synthase/dihydrofolate synthase [Fluoribacter dumoffii]MCW8453757.1 bifunctional tetrahydrofolate synthase/dihydrofolate synthase [Fluoribacter dumoffii]MCW8462172.1 bifunctional tetrahydrofolate synthase/dihydrofolate synthase [Fluoribacter dumoffii]MCW8482384.1 bifunctional tetrahydrofolate synthase/dihydrofolate synthase [Fluoribacter dumoffii]